MTGNPGVEGIAATTAVEPRAISNPNVPSAPVLSFQQAVASPRRDDARQRSPAFHRAFRQPESPSRYHTRMPESIARVGRDNWVACWGVGQNEGRGVDPEAL